MEIRIWGHEISPNVMLVCRSMDVINDVIKQLNDLIRTYGQATIFDLYDVCGLDVPKYVSERCVFLGWVDAPLYNSYGYTTNNRYTCSLPKTVFISNIHTNAPISGKVEIKLKSESPEFKAALPRAAKDAKIQKAYNVLTKTIFNKKADEDDLAQAMEEAIGYLGEVLE